MGRAEIFVSGLLALAAALLSPTIASAQDEVQLDVIRDDWELNPRTPVPVEVTLGIGVSDRSTTGTDSALAGLGYDQQGGLHAGAETRLLLDRLNRYFHLGLLLGVSQQAGALLGATDEVGFRSTIIDAGLIARALLPCISRGSTKWYASGTVGISGLYADAGLGRGGMANGDRVGERRAASRSHDHGGLGWRFGLDAAAHFDHFILGFGAGLRQMFGLDTVHARTWVADAGFRLGARLDL